MANYKNYEGELVTFQLKDNPSLLCRSLTQLEIEITDNGILLKDKETKKDYGYILNIVGVDEEFFFKFFGYESN